MPEEASQEADQKRRISYLRELYRPHRAKINESFKDDPWKKRKKIAQLLMEESQLGRTDPLTNLINNRGFEERLKNEVDRSIRNGHSLGLVEFDIDNFKQLNDKYGHSIGDQVLINIGKLLNEDQDGKESVIRSIDTLARVGGEEFYVILPEIKEGLGGVTERLRKTIENNLGSRIPAIGERKITVSIGATTFTPHIDKDKTTDQIKHEADIALYNAKKSGKNQVTVFKQGMIMPK